VCLHDVGDRLDDGLRRDAVGPVVRDLLVAAALGLVDGARMEPVMRSA
jgi:hypothetical protein